MVSWISFSHFSAITTPFCDMVISYAIRPMEMPDNLESVGQVWNLSSNTHMCEVLTILFGHSSPLSTVLTSNSDSSD
jgi:hypothetical protein